MNSNKLVSSERSTRPDRRIIRTRRSLRDALIALILEKGYESVTIEEITARADLGRTTFYLHFHDKEDLLMCTVRELVEELIEQLSSLPLQEWKAQNDPSVAAEMLTPAITSAFQHVAQNANLYRIILRGDSTYSATQRLRHILVEAVSTLIRHFSNQPGLEISPQVPLEIFVHGLVGAWIGLVTWWLDQGLQYTPEQMGNLYHKMFMRSTRDVLGVSLNPG
jgi:AcrR family transcriptional regulator